MTGHELLSRSERHALELLPWYVNGTLAGDEREQVRRELRSSLTCRLEYDRLRRMQELMQQSDAEHVATDRGFERLMTRIQADGPAARARGAFGRFNWLPLAQAAAVLALVSVIVWWWSADSGVEPRTFETLTTDEPADVPAPRLRLVFVAGVPDETRRAILAELGLRPIAPPTPDGIYTLALPSSADAGRIAERLRADPRIAIVSTPPASEGP